jgi:predicted dehydrogenase
MPISSASSIRCAIIGLGIGKFHYDGYSDAAGAQVVAVADLSEERLQQYKSPLGQENCFTDYRRMLEKVKPDLVSVALPNRLHEEVTIAALESGANVLCEKPMAMTVAQATRMKAAAERCGRMLGINLNQLYSPKAETLKAWIEAGKLGEVYHGYTSWTRQDGIPGFGGWFGQKAMSGGGPLIDLGVHRLAVALWLMGDPEPERVVGYTHHHFGLPRAKKENKPFDVEDFAAGSIRFKNGASLFLEASWDGFQAKRDKMELRLQGSAGAIEDMDELRAFGRSGGIFHQSSLTIAPPSAKTSYDAMVQALRGGEPFRGTPERGIAIQEILDALYLSAESGREVIVEELTH